jgi:hypothetical protein
LQDFTLRLEQCLRVTPLIGLFKLIGWKIRSAALNSQRAEIFEQL